MPRLEAVTASHMRQTELEAYFRATEYSPIIIFY